MYLVPQHKPIFLFQVGPKGKVVGIDHIKELVDDSVNNVRKDDPLLLSSGRVKLLGKHWGILIKEYTHAWLFQFCNYSVVGFLGHE